ATRESIPRCHLTRAALAALMTQLWPGNVRQLGHVLLQACVMADSSLIDVADLAFSDTRDSQSPPTPSSHSHAQPLAATASAPNVLMPRMIENVGHHKLEEKQRILHALEAAGWNRVKAAQALGMPRRTFYRRLVDYSII
ncbi:MAG: hypothetical protein RL701_621, partial [Pseudomonadota bacterium]